MDLDRDVIPLPGIQTGKTTPQPNSVAELTLKEETAWQAYSWALEKAKQLMLQQRGISCDDLRDHWLSCLRAKQDAIGGAQ